MDRGIQEQQHLSNIKQLISVFSMFTPLSCILSHLIIPQNDGLDVIILFGLK